MLSDVSLAKAFYQAVATYPQREKTWFYCAMVLSGRIRCYKTPYSRSLFLSL